MSPKSGRAVSASAGEDYKDKLLRLPAFLTRARQAGVMPGDVKDGLALTGYFFETRVFQPRGDAMPEARRRVVEVLSRDL